MYQEDITGQFCAKLNQYLISAFKKKCSVRDVKKISKKLHQVIIIFAILGDPGTDSGGEGKSKRAEKYGSKKSKERREEPLGTMSYQTSSKRSPPF